MPPPRRLLRTAAAKRASWPRGSGDTDAEMDLLEVALRFEMDGRFGRGAV